MAGCERLYSGYYDRKKQITDYTVYELILIIKKFNICVMVLAPNLLYLPGSLWPSFILTHITISSSSLPLDPSFMHPNALFCIILVPLWQPGAYFGTVPMTGMTRGEGCQ